MTPEEITSLVDRLRELGPVKCSRYWINTDDLAALKEQLMLGNEAPFSVTGISLIPSKMVPRGVLWPVLDGGWIDG